MFRAAACGTWSGCLGTVGWYVTCPNEYGSPRSRRLRNIHIAVLSPLNGLIYAKLKRSLDTERLQQMEMTTDD